MAISTGLLLNGQGGTSNSYHMLLIADQRFPVLSLFIHVRDNLWEVEVVICDTWLEQVVLRAGQTFIKALHE